MSTSSRREKQAELRRRMAEARSKLSRLTEESPNRQDINISSPQQLVETAMATPAAPSASSERGEKRPLFPPTSRGGILRKPKYSNTSSMSDDRALATSSSATALKSMNTVSHYADHQNNTDGGDYDAALSSSSAENGYASRETQINPPRSKRKDTKSSTLFGETESDITTSHVTKVTSTVDENKARREIQHIISGTPESESSIRVTDVYPTPSIQKKSGKVPMISDEVWDEFNALLEEGDTDTSNNTTTDDGNKSSMSEGSTAVAEAGEMFIPTSSTEKKSKKKKKNKEESMHTSKRDMYDNDAAINFEQASYEARLARLMLLKSKKALHRNDDDAASTGGDGVDDMILLKSANEFYDPGLAFQEEGEEGNEDAHYDNYSHGGRSMVENPTSSRGGSDNMEKSSETTTTTIITTSTSEITAPPSQKMTASITAPLSLAKILRKRRDEARKLSSRGADRVGGVTGGSGITPLDDEDDGQWF